MNLLPNRIRGWDCYLDDIPSHGEQYPLGVKHRIQGLMLPTKGNSVKLESDYVSLCIVVFERGVEPKSNLERVNKMNKSLEPMSRV